MKASTRQLRVVPATSEGQENEAAEEEEDGESEEEDEVVRAAEANQN